MIQFIEPTRTEWPEIITRPVFDQEQLEGWVAPILQSVRINGDWAVKEFTQKYDQVKLENLELSSEEWEAGAAQCDPMLQTAVRQAYENIKAFHAKQIAPVEIVENMPGVQCWRRSVPIEKVGFYIPGGTAPLFSSVLMLATPAQLVDCPLRILCTPPSRDGSIHPAILFAAKLAGVQRIFKVGGAQAIAAMAYGTESVPQVYKIAGPGNQYVTMAKQLVSRTGTTIDMPAGPSEVAVVADATSDPEFVAADLLSQAEHGVDSQVLCVCTTSHLAEAIQQATYAQLDQISRKEIAEKALENSRIVILEKENDQLDLINAYAPEHLILATENAEDMALKIINAGSVFIGNYTPESAGDYASGTNHTLPTNGYARIYSGVSVDTYVKKITFQKISPEGLKHLGPTVEIMAAAEGLQAHEKAVSIRLAKIKEA
ncbi:MAG: histidinol dehydrogenase [Bacteroidota bacterium]